MIVTAKNRTDLLGKAELYEEEKKLVQDLEREGAWEI